MKISYLLSSAPAWLPLICTAQETAQQDIIPYIHHLTIWADSATLELSAGSVSHNKLYLCEVEDLVIRDAKGNVLNSLADTDTMAFITEFIPYNTIRTHIYISERIRSARITVSGTLVVESVSAQSLATAYIPLQLDTPAVHCVGEQKLYIHGDKRHKSQNGTIAYDTISISAESDTPSRIQQFRWWKKGSSAADVEEEFECNTIAATGGTHTQEETLSPEIPVNTCTLEVKYWPKGEIVRVPFRFNVSLNKAEPAQP